MRDLPRLARILAAAAALAAMTACVGTEKPVVEATGKSTSLFQDVDFHWFPLSNPGIVSIPLAFFLGWLGTKMSKEAPDVAKTDELEVRALTGIGAEQAVPH